MMNWVQLAWFFTLRSSRVFVNITRSLPAYICNEMTIYSYVWVDISIVHMWQHITSIDFKGTLFTCSYSMLNSILIAFQSCFLYVALRIELVHRIYRILPCRLTQSENKSNFRHICVSGSGSQRLGRIWASIWQHSDKNKGLQSRLLLSYLNLLEIVRINEVYHKWVSTQHSSQKHVSII